MTPFGAKNFRKSSKNLFIEYKLCIKDKETFYEKEQTIKNNINIERTRIK